MPRTDTVARRKGVRSSRGPRLVTSFGEHISSPETVMYDSDHDDDEQSVTPEEQPDTSKFDVTKVVIDRDRLRDLRISEASIEVAEKALGDGASAEFKRGDHVHKVNPYDLYFEDNHNPRDFTPMHMRERVVELTRSIAVRGVRTPLLIYVKGGRLYVNGGETRWRATLHALCFLNVRVERVPVIISQGENDIDRMI